jgi:hypothetical protein
MNKSMAIVMVLSAVVMQAMEIDPWSITIGTTKINVNQGNMYETYAEKGKNVDTVVIGKYGQENYLPMEFGTPLLSEEKKQRIHRFIQQQQDNKTCVMAQEPIIWISYRSQIYCCNFDGPGMLKNDQAIDKTCERLEECYKKSLIEGLEKSKAEKNKSIALPTLCTDLTQTWSLPYVNTVPVVVKAIVEFVQNNPETYDRIELFAEIVFAFDLYKKYFEKYVSKK